MVSEENVYKYKNMSTVTMKIEGVQVDVIPGRDGKDFRMHRGEGAISNVLWNLWQMDVVLHQDR